MEQRPKSNKKWRDAKVLVYSVSSGANRWIWFPGSWEWNSSGWRTRPGLDLHGCRALERRVRGLACLQTGNPICGPVAHFPGADVDLRIGGGRRRPGPVSADGPRHPVSVRSFLEPAQVLGDQPKFRLYRTTTDQWRG